MHVNTVTAEGHDEFGNAVSDSDDARVQIMLRLIDLVIVKEATSPTPLNGIVNYTMTVTNKGPNDATNVQVADPAPAGILYLSASPTQGTCSVAPSLITCSLGTVKKGQTVVIRVTARATTVGTHTNTATVTVAAAAILNPADNVDSAITVVPAPLKPPVAKPQPQPQPEFCLTLTVSPKMIKADGRPDQVTVKVTAGKKRVPVYESCHLGRRRYEERPVERQGHGDAPGQSTEGRPGHDHRGRDQPARVRAEADRRRGGLSPTAHGLAKRGRYVRPRRGCGRASALGRATERGIPGAPDGGYRETKEHSAT